jgi:putative SOS response-associated peptidase YedK
MCGRFLLSLIPEEYAGLLRIDHVPNLGPDLYAPRLNIAPTQQIILARPAAGTPGVRELATARWGMIPPWATPEEALNRPIFNARSETAWEKPLFREAARHRRCVIPADGFYEWRQPATPGSRKQPMLVSRSDSSPMFFAGIWSDWRRKDQPETPGLACCAILTTSPNGAMAPIHDRMPVILLEAPSIDRWLSEQPAEYSDLASLLRPCPSSSLTIKPVDKVGDLRRTLPGLDNRPPSLFD